MKKVKVIFPDGSTADLDEADVDGAIKIGAKRYTGEVSTEKSTSMVFPDGSIADVPNDNVDGAVKVGAKKKVGSNGTSTPDVSGTSTQQSAPIISPSPDATNKGFDFNAPLNNIPNTNVPTITTPDGVSFNFTKPTPLGNSPDNIAALQNRVATKTATDQDIQTIADASGKSLKATQAYIQKGKDIGNAIEANDDIDKTNQQLVDNINDLNKNSSLKLDPNDILSSPQKSANFLQAIKQSQQSEADKIKYSEDHPEGSILEGQTYKTATGFQKPIDTTNSQSLIDKYNTIQTDLINNIKKQTVDEGLKNGLSSEQTADLLYQRLDPAGYLQNQALRKPQNPFNNPYKEFADWVMNSDQKNLEALNYEKAQYSLAVNQGMRDLAVEKKAKGIANNDQSLIDEANTIIPQIKDDKEIIEGSPILMKQQMADYINNRYANDAGLLKGTESTGNLNLLTSGFGVNNTLAKKYLTEGGFYDNPAYKEYADEIVKNPSSYLANNSPFGRMGSSFLKPFVSLFNTLGDLTGIRTAADRNTENVNEELFPEQLTKDVKPTFTLLGHDFNLSNTMASISNLGGYAVLSGLSSGLGTEAGLSANAGERVGAYGAFFMPTVDDGLKEADKMGLTPAQSVLYAGMKGIMFAEGGRLFEFGKVKIPENKVFNETLSKVVTGITDKSLSESGAKEMVDGAVDNWVSGLKKYGVVASNFAQKTAKGASILSGFGIGDSMLKLAFGDKNTNPNDILPQAANGFIDGLFTMGLFGVAGIKGDIDNAKNSTYKGILNKMVDNKDATQDILKIGLDKGLYDQDEYNQKLSILNTGIKAKATLNDAINKTGVKLTPDQKAVWVANATIENSLRNQATIPDVSEADASKYNKLADNFKEQNSKILDGLTFDKFLQPRNDLYDAQKEHQQALNYFTENQTPENEKTVLDKKSVVDKIQNAYTAKDLLPYNHPLLAGMSKEDAVKFIAQQAQNVQADGSISDLQTPEQAKQSTINSFSKNGDNSGEPLVNAAIAAHPLESLIKPKTQTEQSSLQDKGSGGVNEDTKAQPTLPTTGSSPLRGEIGDRLFIPEEKRQNILNEWGRYYGGKHRAENELEDYEGAVNSLHKNGGKVYRVLFVNDVGDINKSDWGGSWTIDKWEAQNIVEQNKQHYGDGKSKSILVEAETPSKNISIDNVDLAGNPHEKEINIIDGSKLKINKLYESKGKDFIEIPEPKSDNTIVENKPENENIQSQSNTIKNETIKVTGEGNTISEGKEDVITTSNGKENLPEQTETGEKVLEKKGVDTKAAPLNPSPELPPEPPKEKEVNESGNLNEWTRVNRGSLNKVKDLFRKVGISWDKRKDAAMEALQSRANEGETLVHAASREMDDFYNQLKNKKTPRFNTDDQVAMHFLKISTEQQMAKLSEDAMKTSNFEGINAIGADVLNDQLNRVNAVLGAMRSESGVGLGYGTVEARLHPDYGFEVRQMQMIRANGGEPLDEEQSKFVKDQWAKEKELMQREQALKEQGMKEDFDKQLADLKNEYEQKLKDKKGTSTIREKTLSQKGKNVADQIRKLKLTGTQVDFTLGTWNLAVEGIAKLVEAGSTIAEAINKLIENKEIGFKADVDKTQFENKFISDLNKQSNRELSFDKIKEITDASKQTEISNDLVAKNLIKDFVESHIGNVDNDKILSEATKKLQEILPDVTKEQVTEAYLKKGDFKQETKKQLETGFKKSQEDLQKIAKKELTANQQQKIKLQAEKEKTIKQKDEFKRKLDAGEFETQPQIQRQSVHLNKSDAELIKLQKERSQVESTYRKEQNKYQEQHKSGLERATDTARSLWVMYLIGHPKTLAKIAWMSLVRPTSEGLSKFTFGQAYHLIDPTIYNRAKAGGESSSFRTLQKMGEAYYHQLGEKGVEKLYTNSENKYLQKLKAYNDYKQSSNPSETKLKSLKKQSDNAMLSSIGNLMYQYMGGGSFKDAFQALIHRTNEIERQFGKVSQDSFKDGNWLDKVNYVAGYVGRSHSAAKTFSGRASFAAGFMARVEDAINNGEPIDANKVLEMAHESYLDWERGKYQQSNYISDKWNQIVNNIEDKYGKQNPKFDKYDKAVKTLVKTEVAITRVPVNIIHEEVAEYLLGAFRAPVMALKEYRNANKQAISEFGDKIKESKESEVVNSPEFKQRIKEIVSGMDADQAARIVRCFRKGGLGLGLYATALIWGGIHFGIFPHKGQPKTKDDNKLKKGELNPGQVMIGNDKMGEVISGMISHTPALWDTFMGLGLAKIYNDDIKGIGHKQKASATKAAADAILTHLKIIEGNIPQTKIVSPTQTIQDIGTSLKKTLSNWGIIDDSKNKKRGQTSDIAVPNNKKFSILDRA